MKRAIVEIQSANVFNYNSNRWGKYITAKLECGHEINIKTQRKVGTRTECKFCKG